MTKLTDYFQTTEAAEYKHVVLRLIFLKYISDAFLALVDNNHAETPLLGEIRDSLLSKLTSGELAERMTNGEVRHVE